MFTGDIRVFLTGVKILLLALSVLLIAVVFVSEVIESRSRAGHRKDGTRRAGRGPLMALGGWMWALSVPVLLAGCTVLYFIGMFSSPLFLSVLFILFLQEKASLRTLALFLCTGIPIAAVALQDEIMDPVLTRGAAIVATVALAAYILVESRVQKESDTVWRGILKRIRRPEKAPGEKTRALVGTEGSADRLHEKVDPAAQAGKMKAKGYYSQIP